MDNDDDGGGKSFDSIALLHVSCNNVHIPSYPFFSFFILQSDMSFASELLFTLAHYTSYIVIVQTGGLFSDPVSFLSIEANCAQPSN
ncbi:MAG: hypothetical protein J3R72DRAFT_441253, partial [Linnemannia gamsii]